MPYLHLNNPETVSKAASLSLLFVPIYHTEGTAASQYSSINLGGVRWGEGMGGVWGLGGKGVEVGWRGACPEGKALLPPLPALPRTQCLFITNFSRCIQADLSYTPSCIVKLLAAV